MNVVRREKNTNYTTISNGFIKDRSLSLKAKGLLATVMSMPDDWDFSINGIVSIVKDGRTAVYSAINELKESGYCSVSVCRDDKNVIKGCDYTFYESPHSGFPHTENPHTENPHTENQPQSSTYSNNTCNDNTTKGIKNEINNIVEIRKKAEDEFVDRMYRAYPSKCPMRGTTLGKCMKDKARIRALLKTYSMEQVEKVFAIEIKNKYGKQYMQNFSTFLNNFPDPNLIEEVSQPQQQPQPKQQYQQQQPKKTFTDWNSTEALTEQYKIDAERRKKIEEEEERERRIRSFQVQILNYYNLHKGDYKTLEEGEVKENELFTITGLPDGTMYWNCKNANCRRRTYYHEFVEAIEECPLDAPMRPKRSDERCDWYWDKSQKMWLY